MFVPVSAHRHPPPAPCRICSWELSSICFRESLRAGRPGSPDGPGGLERPGDVLVVCCAGELGTLEMPWRWLMSRKLEGLGACSAVRDEGYNLRLTEPLSGESMPPNFESGIPLCHSFRVEPSSSRDHHPHEALVVCNNETSARGLATRQHIVCVEHI